ncbi:Hypothetical protein FKW44_008249 [Caligus rogercresseyi]|uniref:Uncharacterized protein n=1 Tax=Caligus rogercresseyi TaxID=217165 RepID=A0A7T8KFV7_CALRO|nr:Hypothetical protein FKW44_008249 [Caligus rogercresseyi]
MVELELIPKEKLKIEQKIETIIHCHFKDREEHFALSLSPFSLNPSTNQILRVNARLSRADNLSS